MRHNLQFNHFSTGHICLWVCWARSHLSYSVGWGGEGVFTLFLRLQSGAGQEGCAHWALSGHCSRVCPATDKVGLGLGAQTRRQNPGLWPLSPTTS